MQLTHSIADIYFYAHLILETCVLNEKQVVCFQIGCHENFFFGKKLLALTVPLLKVDFTMKAVNVIYI